jgi:hypothetical protein
MKLGDSRLIVNASPEASVALTVRERASEREEVALKVAELVKPAPFQLYSIFVMLSCLRQVAVTSADVLAELY